MLSLLWPGCGQAAGHRDLERELYKGFGPTLASEYLAKKHKLEVSKETVRKWMKEAGLWRSRKQRVAEVHMWRARRARFRLSIGITPRKVYPPDEAAQKRWLKSKRESLDDGKIKKLVTALRKLAHSNPELLRAIRLQTEYFEGNQHRMRHPVARRQCQHRSAAIHNEYQTNGVYDREVAIKRAQSAVPEPVQASSDNRSRDRPLTRHRRDLAR